MALGVHTAQAQQSLGSLGGRAVAGATLQISNAAVGIVRSSKADASGSYNFSSLPAGVYTVTLTASDGRTVVRTVEVVGGAGAVANFVDSQDRVVITSAVVASLDTRSVESSTILTKGELDRIPVSKDTTSIALLAPGATLGDARFGNVASLGGASPAENTYYVNGFNVTNILDGLRFNQIPPEAIAVQEIKNGGYSAEFGRSLGGVVNVVTKRGTNEFKGGTFLSFEPASLAGGELIATEKNAQGVWQVKKVPGGTDTILYNVYGGGPVVKDKLFFFGLVQGINSTTKSYGYDIQSESRVTTPQYLVKLDWNLSSDNLVEFTAFSDKRTFRANSYRSPVPLETQRGDLIGPATDVVGGSNMVASWTGRLTDSLGFKLMAGTGSYNRKSQAAGTDCPIVLNRLAPPFTDPGCWNPFAAVVTDPNANDRRTATRADFEWNLNRHTVRFGLDNESIRTVDGSRYSGAGLYRVAVLSPGQSLPNGFDNTGTSPIPYVRFSYFENGGTFTTKNTAWYLEDSWDATKNLVLSFGIRNEAFKNLNGEGNPFIKISNSIAPRLGAVWDLQGNAQTKLYASAGRYFIPVYANTNVRLSGREIFYSDFYRYGGSFTTDRFQTPTLGAKLGDRVTISNGETPDPRTVVDNRIKPMYQDELIVGLDKALQNKWTVGVRLIHRKLKSQIDDICEGELTENWALSNGFTPDQAAAIGGAVGHCFLYNPGSDLSANVDLNGDGKLSVVNIPASALQIPKARRTYDALVLTFERAWDKKWSLKGSYTLSYNKGNTEGYVKSDIGQRDAGITQDFDHPGLMQGAYGYLPNDRRHTLKAFGSYAVNDQWRLGGNLLIQTGRPKNCFGVYGGNLESTSQFYGDASFYCGGKLLSRGAFGRTGTIVDLGVQIAYMPAAIKGLTLATDITNILNRRTTTVIAEGESSGVNDPSSSYGIPQAFQADRRVRLTARYEF